MNGIEVSRRSVLKSGAFAPLAYALPGLAHATVDAWVLDTRYAGVADVDTGSAPRWHFSGDVTRLWLDELDPRWRQRGFVVGGYTGESTLFLLDRLAHDRGRRVVERHSIPAVRVSGGRLVRWTIAPVHASVLP